MSDLRLAIPCPQCGLRQYTGETCRRCGRQLPQPEVRVEVHTVDKTFGPTAPVIPLAELKRRAIIHALERAPNGIEAARLLGIGKTTLYAKMQAYGIRLPASATETSRDAAGAADAKPTSSR